MQLQELLGFAAAILTTIAFLPQAIHIVKTRHTAGLSFLMLSLQSSGCFLWMLYGIWVRSPSLITANFLTTSIVITVFVIKYKTERRHNQNQSLDNKNIRM